VCGIVGYWGPKKPKEVILDGLKRLEYRGYDSTGVAIFDRGQLKVARSPGKLIQLEEKIKNVDFSGPTGIGHTRWATHGEPSERNAHPHKVGSVAIVHNGIIENFREIRERLLAQKVELKSETDSELIAHLLDQQLKIEKSLFQAVIKIIPQLRGAYSILAVNENEPDNLIAFKNGPPMLVGIGKDEVIIASDIQAIISWTHRVVYMDDGEIVRSSKGKVDFFNSKGESVNKKIQEMKWDETKAEKAGFSHFMLKEIYEQPEAIRKTMEPHLDLKNKVVELKDLGLTPERLKKIKRIRIVACGTSWHAALIGKYVLEKMAGIPTDVDIASEFQYRSLIVDPIGSPDLSQTLIVTISQSGETADTLACLRKCKKLGFTTLSICNVQHSSIDREADGRIYTRAGVEIGVCSTKSFTAQIVVLELFALHLARHLKYGIAEKEIQKAVEALLAIPGQVEICLNHDKWFKEAAHSLSHFKGFLYLGRGINYPVALEGALKLKEITYLHAEGYPSGELKHGPIALVDKDMAIVAMAPQDELYEKNISNIQEVKARGGQVIAIGTGDDKVLVEMCRHYLSIPQTLWFTNPILESIPVQLLSYHLAVELKRDVDQPRNLAKSVTVE
jgi:glucosamine--fructose-6-phosphate aminotransferase (isomerizing)